MNAHKVVMTISFPLISPEIAQSIHQITFLLELQMPQIPSK